VPLLETFLTAETARYQAFSHLTPQLCFLQHRPAHLRNPIGNNAPSSKVFGPKSASLAWHITVILLQTARHLA
jgi:hypothetical protein